MSIENIAWTLAFMSPTGWVTAAYMHATSATPQDAKFARRLAYLRIVRVMAEQAVADGRTELTADELYEIAAEEAKEDNWALFDSLMSTEAA